jgi:hypothetical protein
MTKRRFPIPAAAGLVLTGSLAAGCFGSGDKDDPTDPGDSGDSGDPADSGDVGPGEDTLEGGWNLDTVDGEVPGYTYTYDGCTYTYSYTIVMAFGAESEGAFSGTWTSSYTYTAEGDACFGEGTYTSEPVEDAATASRTDARAYAIAVTDNGLSMECSLDEPSQGLSCAALVDGVTYALEWSAE